ncbi:MAG: hypothetical protein QW631_02870, partial [Candidatus Aenigmatarchaeota archaeon]
KSSYFYFTSFNFWNIFAVMCSKHIILFLAKIFIVSILTIFEILRLQKPKKKIVMLLKKRLIK